MLCWDRRFLDTFFTEVGERVNLKSEELKRVRLGEEHCWKDLVDGNPQFRRRKKNVRRKSRLS